MIIFGGYKKVTEQGWMLPLQLILEKGGEEPWEAAWVVEALRRSTELRPGFGACFKKWKKRWELAGVWDNLRNVLDAWPLKPRLIKNIHGQVTLCQDPMPRVFHMIDLILIKVLQGHYHSHFAAETEAQTRKWQIQALYSSVWWNLCAFALLSSNIILAHFFSWKTPIFSTLWIQLAILRKRWLTG